MKTIYALFFLLITTVCSSQELGVYKIDVEGTYNSKSPVYEEWLREDGHVTMRFRSNAVGLKHAIEKVEDILDVNKMLSALPASDETTKGSDVADEENYEQWHNSIRKGNSEIKRVYQFPNYKLLQIFFTLDGYEINIMGVL